MMMRVIYEKTTVQNHIVIVIQTYVAIYVDCNRGAVKKPGYCYYVQ